MISIELKTENDAEFKDYESIIKSDWEEDYLKEKQYFKYASIYVIKQDQKVVGGFLITKKSMNFFKEEDNLNLVDKLETQNIKNFSYFIIDEEKRGQGIGYDAMTKFLKDHKNLWLSSKENTKQFYEKLGFKQINKKINGDNLILMYSDKLLE